VKPFVLRFISEKHLRAFGSVLETFGLCKQERNASMADLLTARLSPSGSVDTASAIPTTLEVTGTLILRYGLVLALLFFGAQKWTRAEAEGIQPLVAHSPFLSWIYQVMSIQRGSELIGTVELAIGLLIAIRHWSPKLCAVGSTGAVFMFLTTLSFLVTTPGLDSGTQGFIIKDVFLLGAAVWSAGEALRSARAQ
jgi:uncharacterized membrane protein YkgB